MDKCGEDISPFNVAPPGGRQMHAVGTGFRFREKEQTFAVDSRSEPDLSKGIHCCLWNKAWETNCIQWYGEDMRFRFIVRA